MAIQTIPETKIVHCNRCHQSWEEHTHPDRTMFFSPIDRIRTSNSGFWYATRIDLCNDCCIDFDRFMTPLGQD